MAMINITELSEQDLQLKIKNTKYEVNRVSAALKRYEDELERRKQEVPLGVPLPDQEGAPFVGVYELGFSSEKSFFTFSTRFQNYVTATRDNSKSKSIDIQVLLPLLKKGWVAMDIDKSWYWFPEKPQCDWNTATWSSPQLTGCGYCTARTRDLRLMPAA